MTRQMTRQPAAGGRPFSQVAPVVEPVKTGGSVVSPVAIPVPPADTRAVLLLVDVSLADDRQSRVAMKYASEHALRIVAHAGHQPAAAAAAVAIGTASVVLAALQPPAPIPALVALEEEFGGDTVVYARPSYRTLVALDRERQLVATALANSDFDVDLVVRILGLPVGEVQAVASEVRRRLRVVGGGPE